jgi:predicted dehydrogenase
MMTGAIVGFGEVAEKGHWPAYASSSDTRIGAVVDPDPVRRALAERIVPGVRTYASLDRVESSLQFADICTPPSLHQQSVLDALARGWHVLCEKPFVLRSALVAPIRAEARARNLAVLPVHNWKYAPILRRATQLLNDGAIGALREVAITTIRSQAAATTGGTAYNWRHDPAVAGGGILMDHGWHAVYLALHWFGEAPGRVAADLRSSSGYEVESDVDLRIQFPSGSARIVLTWNGNVRRNAITLRGQTGEIVVEDGTLTCASRGRVERFEPLSAGSHHPEWFSAMLADVLASFAEPGRSGPALDEAEQCIGLIEQAYAGAPAAS